MKVINLIASLDSLESAKLIYWVYVGQMTSGVVVSPQRFRPLPVGASSPNFQDVLFLHGLVDAGSFFW